MGLMYEDSTESKGPLGMTPETLLFWELAASVVLGRAHRFGAVRIAGSLVPGCIETRDITVIQELGSR